MLSLLVAAGTVEKVAWVVGALVLLVLGGAAASLVRKHDKSDRGHDLSRDVDASFRKPPNEGGLL